MRTCIAWPAVLGALLLPQQVVAQQIAGMVVDGATGAGVDAALVQLIAHDSSVVASAITNTRGTFDFPRRVEGAHYLRVSRLGYREVREVAIGRELRMAGAGGLRC